MFASACSNIFVRLKNSGVSRSRRVFLSTSWSACLRSMSADESLRMFRPTRASSRSDARPRRPLKARKSSTTVATTRPPIRIGNSIGFMRST